MKTTTVHGANTLDPEPEGAAPWEEWRAAHWVNFHLDGHVDPAAAVAAARERGILRRLGFSHVTFRDSHVSVHAHWYVGEDGRLGVTYPEPDPEDDDGDG